MVEAQARAVVGRATGSQPGSRTAQSWSSAMAMSSRRSLPRACGLPLDAASQRFEIASRLGQRDRSMRHGRAKPALDERGRDAMTVDPRCRDEIRAPGGGARPLVPQHRPPRRADRAGPFPRRLSRRMKWRRFADARSRRISRGKSVLDIGCNGGFYSIEMKRRGAARVLGIDSDEDYLAQARFAAEVLGPRHRVPRALRLRRRRARRALRHRAVHGRALPPAPSAARARPDPRACRRRPAGLPVHAARQRRGRRRLQEDYPFWDTAPFDRPD